MLRIARNTAINFLTRRKHRPLGTGGCDGHRLIADHTAPDEVTDDFDTEYESELFRWASVQVREIVTERTWQAFWQTTMEDRPVAEVAAELQMSVGSVYISRSRVMAPLRQLVLQFEECAV